jgi:hypothetical protein
MSGMKDNFIGTKQGFVLHSINKLIHPPINIPALLFLTPKSKNGNNNDDGPY